MDRHFRKPRELYESFRGEFPQSYECVRIDSDFPGDANISYFASPHIQPEQVFALNFNDFVGELPVSDYLRIMEWHQGDAELKEYLDLLMREERSQPAIPCASFRHYVFLGPGEVEHASRQLEEGHWRDEGDIDKSLNTFLDLTRLAHGGGVKDGPQQPLSRRIIWREGVETYLDNVPKKFPLFGRAELVTSGKKIY